MRNYRNFKDYHIERLRDPENAKIYFSVACDNYKENKDIGAFLLAVGDVAEARGRNFDDFLKEAGIFEEVSALRASEELSKPIDRFFQWFREVVRSFFPSPLAFCTAGFAVLVVIGGFYFGNRYFGGGVPVPEGVTRENGVVPRQVESKFVRGVGEEVKDSPSGFGAFPKIPMGFPDQNIWNVVEKRSIHDPDSAKTLELLARVRIKLWEEGMHTKGVIMDPSSGLIYLDSRIKILPDLRMSASPDSRKPQYYMYFDDGLIPQGQISVKFLGRGIDPYEFLNLPR